MRAVDIIRKKRDGQENTREEIQFLIQRHLDSVVPDYQIAAWLMAAFIRGLSDNEMSALTRAMVESGKTVQLPSMTLVKVDKHSTGGVGDKTSLVVAPIVAAAGVVVPMISGRALGHTGGTLDKLEAIPGFRTDLSLEEFQAALREYGLALIGQTAELNPADRRLYALRDATATVESIPLIVASIISKKAVEGIDALVLDVKTGYGAFIQEQGASRQLALRLINAAQEFGIRAAAVLSDMSQPLGNAVGNSLEVAEAVRTLQGKGPEDLVELSLEIAGLMLVLGGAAESHDAGKELARRKMETGVALEKFADLLFSQGSVADIRRLLDELPRSRHVYEYGSPREGYLAECRADQIGWASVALGAGRDRKEAKINAAAGIELLKKRGAPVREGDALALLHYDEAGALERALGFLPAAFEFSETPPPPRPLVQEILGC
ncbi:MAG: thymidine phosphorylase [Acidobacteria bacterium]|nr:thymidine phosphorylase [Acidobacteriota bacterium]